MNFSRSFLSKSVFNWFLLFISYGIFWGFLGILFSKDFVNDFIRLNVLWVTIYLLIVLSIHNFASFKIIFKTLIIASLFISIYNINTVLITLDLPNIPFLNLLNSDQRIGIHLGYFQLTAHNLGSLNFLTPFLISLFLLKNTSDVGFSKFTIYIVLVINLIAVFFSGRRALWFLVILAPLTHFFTLILLGKIKVTFRRVIHIFFLLILFSTLIYTIFSYFDINLVGFLDRLLFRGDQNVGLSYRAIYIQRLITETLNSNFLFGTGGGSAAFEVSFAQVFHETGIVGLIIYFFLFFWVLVKLFAVSVRRSNLIVYSIPLIIGFISFFLAMWTNPYFNSFDFMWIIFLPVAFINLDHLNQENLY
jgi:hypothetical protein